MESTGVYYFSKIFLFIYVITLYTLSHQSEYSGISQLIGVALTFVFLIETLNRKEYIFYIPLPIIFYIIYLLILTISTLFFPNEYKLLFTIIQIIILSIIIVNIVGHGGKLWPLIMGTFIGTIILNYQLWSYLGNTFNLEGRRMPSDYINSNTYSMYLCLGILVCIYGFLLLRAQQSELNKVLTWIFKIILFFIVIFYSYLVITLTGSRKGILAIFIIFFGYGLYTWKTSNLTSKFIYIFSVPLLLGILFNNFQNTVGFKRFETMLNVFSDNSNTDSSTNTRTGMIFDAINFWSEKPVWGWGVNQFRRISDYGTYSHNNFVEILANSGLIGFITYYGIFVSILFMLINSYKKIDEKQRSKVFWCSLVILILLFWDVGLVSYYSKFNWLIISMIVGLLVSYKTKENKDKSYGYP